MKKLTLLSAPLFAVTMALSGCQSAYYSAMESVGVHKRDILVDRVEETKESQTSKINEKEINKENIVNSPMVGVIYLTPEPTKPTFIKEGQHVKQGDVLMLIEAMKTFNEITAPKSGIIKKILVLNSQPVEYGEPLIIFE